MEARLIAASTLLLRHLLFHSYPPTLPLLWREGEGGKSSYPPISLYLAPTARDFSCCHRHNLLTVTPSNDREILYRLAGIFLIDALSLSFSLSCVMDISFIARELEFSFFFPFQLIFNSSPLWISFATIRLKGIFPRSFPFFFRFLSFFFFFRRRKNFSMDKLGGE